MKSTRTERPASADYVIVGAGSAGAALAARLSASGEHSVVLLEAGPSARAQAVTIPAAFSQLFKSERDWNYETTPQPGLGGRTVYWPRGKMLGGSSSMNAMMWVRGFAADYDDWAEVAGPEWSYSALLPYFRRVERVSGSSDPEHGVAGAVHVEAQRDPRPHTAAFLQAVVEAGYDVEAANARHPRGFSQTMVSQSRGARSSTATTYLKAARSRRNLAVLTGAHATRIAFDGTRATGVHYRQGDTDLFVRARVETVLCGGAINTPQLLQLSGVGDADHLRSHGIEVVAEAPEVGANLRDHLVAFLVPEVERGTLMDATSVGQLAKYLTGRRGMLTSNIGEAYGFIQVGDEAHRSDVELIFAPAAYVDEGLAGIPSHAITLGAILLQPKSRGTITLRSTDPFDKPVIDPRYLSDPADLDTLLAGMVACEDILSTPTMKQLTTGRYVCPPGSEALTAPDRDRKAVLNHAHTLYHPTSTARMGSDADSVVDPQLRVRGVSGLRVADASVMPEIIRGHTNAPAIVIGEKAADLLLAER
ncbi:MAG TPA: GMC family oxidoreductase N-terminal domain-containing protein [Umezawaea sp.]|nr:GMC family oxidoreductase N-terminal domain-containing protein [Umezawaea sp.]